MKLYYSPGACSLASYISLHEAGVEFDHEAVDLKAKLTASGADFTAIAPKGYVPALVLEEGELLTENVAVLDYIAAQYPQVGIDGPLGRSRLIEALAFIATEIHKSFKPFFRGASDADKAEAGAYIVKRMTYLSDRMTGAFLFGDRPSTADFYLFVTLLWSQKFGIVPPAPLAAMFATLMTRPSVVTSFAEEGLD